MRWLSHYRAAVGLLGTLAVLCAAFVLMPPRAKPAPVEKGVVSAGDLDGSGVTLPPADNLIESTVQNRAIYPVCSQRVDRSAPGGFGPSDNTAKRVTAPASRALYLLAEPDVEVPLRGKTKGMRLQLVNGSGKEVAFSACDSCLSIVQQAQDTDGTWRDIEYRPSSWCGNSYHTVYLSPGFGWSMPALRYRGPLATKLRFALGLEDAKVLYSNEFDGSIHPDQFAVKAGHRATNIMDPYLD